MTQATTVPRLVQALKAGHRAEVPLGIAELLKKQPEALLQEIEAALQQLMARVRAQPLYAFECGSELSTAWQLAQLLCTKSTRHYLSQDDPEQCGIAAFTAPDKKTGKTLLLTPEFLQSLQHSELGTGNLEHLLRQWRSVICWWWSAKITSDIVGLLRTQQLQLTEPFTQLIGSRMVHETCLPTRPIAHILDIEDCPDSELYAARELCAQALWGSADCGLRAADEFDDWCKRITIADLLDCKLTFDGTDKILGVVSSPMSHLEVRLRWSAHWSRYLCCAYVAPAAHACHDSFWAQIPMSLLHRFGSEASPETQDALVRLVLRESWSTAQRLLGNDFNCI